MQVTDPPRIWIFTIEAGSNYEKEENQNELSFDSEIEVNKITLVWKTNFEAGYNADTENYFDNREKISVRQNEVEIRDNFVRSLSPWWSAGIFGGYYSQTYLNIQN